MVLHLMQRQAGDLGEKSNLGARIDDAMGVSRGLR